MYKKNIQEFRIVKNYFCYDICNGSPSPLALETQIHGLLLTKEEEMKEEVQNT